MSFRNRWTPALDWEQVREIRAQAATVKVVVLAERYDVAVSNITSILRNESWHDPDYRPGLERACLECAGSFVTLRMNRRFCSPRCRGTYNMRRHRGHRRRGQAQRDLKRTRSAARNSLRQPSSLDRVVGEGGTTLGELQADVRAADPARAVELAEVAEILAGVDVDALDDAQRIELRRRLVAAGHVPSVMLRG